MLFRSRFAVEALLPDGHRQPVAAYEARPGWERRYWLARALRLPAGTVLSVAVREDQSAEVWLDVADVQTGAGAVLR